MFLRRWSIVALAVLAVGGLLLTQTGCPTADTPAPSSGGGSTDPAPPVEVDEEGGEDTASVGTPYELKLPLGLPKVPIPADNPLTEEKISLGKKLYFDTALSKDGTVACFTCHDPSMAWAEHTPTSTGIGDQLGGANSPTVINSAYGKTQFWDGRAASLEEQALGPIENSVEMGHKLDDLVKELAENEEYTKAFEAAFGTPEVTNDRIAKAIASFERTVLSGNSPYDKFVAGDESALSDAAKRGQDVFFDVAACDMCHTPPVFSGYKFFNAGIGMDKDPPDQGRKAVTGKDADLGKIRVPMLRDVANTGPYFHDGSVASLEEAVKIMAQGGKPNDNLSSMMAAVGKKEITDEQINDLIEFLKALSGEFPKE